MRDETRRKLGRRLALKRGVSWLAIALGAAALVALAFIGVPSWTVREVEAVVRVAVVKGGGKSANAQATLELELADGRIVRGRGLAPIAPPRPGARIIVRERTMLGFRSYEWHGRTP